MFFFSKDVDFKDIAIELDRTMVKKIVPLIEKKNVHSDEVLAKELKNLLPKIRKLRIVTDDGKPTFYYEPQYCYAIGEIFRRQEKFLDAIAWYLMGCTRECDFSSPYMSIAGILKEYGKYKSAFSVYLCAQQLFPKDYKVNLRMAILSYYHLNDGNFVDYLMVAQNSFSDYNGLKYAIRGLYSQMYDLDKMFTEYKLRRGA